MGLYDIAYDQVALNVLPIGKRRPRYTAWLKALYWPLQWLNNNFNKEYVGGSNAPLWLQATNYFIGDRVVDPNGSVWECYRNLNVGNRPSTTNDPRYWQPISPDWRGVRERIKYDGKKITLEYVLNRFYKTTWIQPIQTTNPQPARPAIYIDNNNPSNNVFVIGPTEPLSSEIVPTELFASTFITNTYSFANSNCFTIWVPVAFYATLGIYAEQRIRAIADRYVIAGMTYFVQTY